MDFDRQTISGVMAASSKLKKVPGASASGLHIINDEQDVVLVAQLRKASQPGGPGGPEPALALDSFHDHRGRLVEA